VKCDRLGREHRPSPTMLMIGHASRRGQLNNIAQ